MRPTILSQLVNLSQISQSHRQHSSTIMHFKLSRNLKQHYSDFSLATQFEMDDEACMLSSWSTWFHSHSVIEYCWPEVLVLPLGGQFKLLRKVGDHWWLQKFLGTFHFQPCRYFLLTISNFRRCNTIDSPLLSLPTSLRSSCYAEHSKF